MFIPVGFQIDIGKHPVIPEHCFGLPAQGGEVRRPQLLAGFFSGTDKQRMQVDFFHVQHHLGIVIQAFGKVPLAPQIIRINGEVPELFPVTLRIQVQQRLRLPAAGAGLKVQSALIHHREIKFVGHFFSRRFFHLV